jgi:hypothetical protein
MFQLAVFAVSPLFCLVHLLLCSHRPRAPLRAPTNAENCQVDKCRSVHGELSHWVEALTFAVHPTSLLELEETRYTRIGIGSFSQTRPMNLLILRALTAIYEYSSINTPSLQW